MNRIVLATEIEPSFTTPPDSSNLHDLSTATRLRTSRGTELPYSTFAPIHYEEGYAYPLIVWLHGTAGSEHELRKVMPLVSMRNYVAVAPRGSWTDTRYRGRYGWRQTADGIESAEARVAECVAVAKQRFNVHPNRIFLVGRGSGGTMAMRVAWNNPNAYTGVAAIDGPLPTRLQPLSRVNELRQIPCLLTTARDSRTYPASRVCRDLRLLHVAGCTVALRQYPGADGLTRNMLSDLDHWLMELVCETRSSR